MAVKELGKGNFDSEIAKGTVLVDFWAAWCIDPKASISVSERKSKQAGEVEAGDQVICFDGRVKASTVSRSKTSEEAGHCVAIETETGRVLRLTDDHKIYTPRGWVQAREIKNGDRVLVLPVVEPVKVPKQRYVIVDEADVAAQATERMKTREYLRELKRLNLLPMQANDERLPIIARLMGALFSDGSMYSREKNNYREISFTLGGEKDADDVKKDLASLGFTKTHGGWRVTKNKIAGREFSRRVFRLKCPSTSLWLLFKALGVPAGNKQNRTYGVPRWLLKAPLLVQREFLAGYLGGNGPRLTLSLQDRPKKKPYNCVRINDLEFHKRGELKKSGLDFARDISKMLSRFGVKVRKIFAENETSYTRADGSVPCVIHICFAKDFETAYALSSKIGYAYCQQKRDNASFAAEFLRKRLLERKRWHALWGRVRSLLRKGKSAKEISALLGLSYDTVFGWVGPAKKPTTSKHFEKYPAWLAERKEGLTGGVLWEDVTCVKKTYLPKVTSISVPGASNFFANGILVHNCGPCRMLAPVIEEMSGSVKGVKFGKVDITAEQEIAARFGVMSIPTLILFKNGEEVDRLIGAYPREVIEKWIKEKG